MRRDDYAKVKRTANKKNTFFSVLSLPRLLLADKHTSLVTVSEEKNISFPVRFFASSSRCPPHIQRNFETLNHRIKVEPQDVSADETTRYRDVTLHLI